LEVKAVQVGASRRCSITWYV